MTRVAAIDCGTNSIRLLVADIDNSGAQARVTDVDRRMIIVRLGEGVDRTGQFSPAALERTFAACRDYAEVIETTGAQRVRFVATSASRDVSNRDEFIEGVRGILGVEPEVITGAEEASLSFSGAVGGLADGVAPAPRLVVDIGGGSTECVLGDTEPIASYSVDIGCVRMTERHLRSDPPTAEQIEATRADIAAALDEVERHVPLHEAASMVGLAGTVTTISAIAHHLTEYDPTFLHGSVITAEQIDQVVSELVVMSHDERAAMSVMHPGRVDVIAGGGLVLQAVVRRVGVAAVIVSESDILDGIARRLGVG
jgi:exopolyphosphatase/guanosine-5'-triphosphate,3'-diphosphate pyrophosphatase